MRYLEVNVVPGENDESNDVFKNCSELRRNVYEVVTSLKIHSKFKNECVMAFYCTCKKTPINHLCYIEDMEDPHPYCELTQENVTLYQQHWYWFDKVCI